MHDLGAGMAVAAALVLAAVVASRVGARFGVPALLLFLGVGMLAGSDGPSGIAFDDARLAQDVGVIALALILFAGGLSTDWGAARSQAGRALGLATVGVVVTAAVAGVAAAWALDLPIEVGLLLGAVVASTDAAAVFAELRSRSLHLRGGLDHLLELESGGNDPMAVFLTVALLTVITEPDRSVVGLLPTLLVEVAVGAAVGLVVAAAAVRGLNRLRHSQEGLFPVVTVAVAVGTYGTAVVLHGSGFLAVYVAGLAIGRRDFLHRRSVLRFHDGMAWLAQIAMFLVLGLLVFPSELPDVVGPGLLVAAALILVARPLAAAVTLLPTGLPLRDTVLVAWVGLRGAVPIVLATFPLVEGIPEAALLFDAVFFVVLASVLVQGTTIGVVARALGVESPTPPPPPPPIEAVGAIGDDTELHEVVVGPGSPAAGRRLVDLGLPPGALVVLVRRDGRYVVPTGATDLRAGDAALVLADPPALARLHELLAGAPREAPRPGPP